MDDWHFGKVEQDQTFLKTSFLSTDLYDSRDSENAVFSVGEIVEKSLRIQTSAYRIYGYRIL